MDAARFVRRVSLGAAFCALAAFTLALPSAADDPPAPKKGTWSATKGLVLKGKVVTMDGDRRVLATGSVFVKDKKIVAVAARGQQLPPEASAATVIDTKGVIAPGLIDAHNHLEYDFIRMWDLPQKYVDMYEWMGSKLYEKAIKYPKRVLSADLDLTGEIGKYSEIKAIAGGATAVQGAPVSSAYTKHFVRNVEFPNFGRDRVQQRSIGIMDSRWRTTLETGLLKNIRAGKLDCWLVHLAEGVDEKSRAEFDDLEKLGLLVKETAIIHGIALKAAEFKKMAAVGAKLVTSPLDNYLLYGQTADLVAAHKAGVKISIGADWSPFGSKNLLAELKVCHQLNSKVWNNYFTNRQLVEMVTVNPAATIGWTDYAGSLVPGLYGDITVFDALETDPYASIVKATELNVQLVLVGGEPLYGDLATMKKLKGDDCEIVFESGNRKKAVDITTDDPTVAKGTQKFSEIKKSLEQALKMDPSYLYEHSAQKATMTRAEYDAYLKKTYKLGLDPATLDPVVAVGDTHYLETILGSRNTGIKFDLGSYYGTTPGLAPAVPSSP